MKPKPQGPRDDVDDAIAALNSPPPRGRKDSADSINFRDTGFDPSGGHRKNDSGSFIQPIPVNGADFGGGGAGDISHREAGNFLDDEEKEAEEQRRLEEEKKKNQQSPNKEFFRDAKGNIFDPNKKFGIIGSESLLYGDITSSYPLNLPTDYYQKYILSTLPSKDA
jgi:hypothetical protein